MKRSRFFAALLIGAAFAAAGCSDGSSGKDRSPANPRSIPKFVEPLTIPPAMAPSGTVSGEEYYEIAVKQFTQQILPTGFPETTVWGYGKADDPSSFSYPARTIEARANTPLRVKWINGLKNSSGEFLPYFLPVDSTIHWADPADTGVSAGAYKGPVPVVTHVHGSHVNPDSDGHPLAWYLPDATDIPAGMQTQGPQFADAPGAPHEDGAAYFRYINTQSPATLWYHDHALGVTRLNIYAGLTGYYLVRDPEAEPSGLPGPAPQVGDPEGTKYYEIPLVIQDRSFNADGSLFYPSSRTFFDGFTGPFRPDGPVPPVWNPEFFAETIVVNGKTWPYLDVEPRKYRFRLLNACNSRFLILNLIPIGTGDEVPFKVIGNDGGYLPGEPLVQRQVVLGPAERFDVIVDFSRLKPGDEVLMANLAPDEPFKGWGSPDNGPPADQDTTGQVMKFKVVASTGTDTSTSPNSLPSFSPLSEESAAATRDLTLSESVLVTSKGEFPTGSFLGTLTGGDKEFMDPITETPALNSNEVWRLINLTGDAHPIHLHLVRFNVLYRRSIDSKALADAQKAFLEGTGPEPELSDFYTAPAEPPFDWEVGDKDTIAAPPGMVTTVIARFDILGEYVWHCHILEHEDNEMMRPFQVVE